MERSFKRNDVIDNFLKRLLSIGMKIINDIEYENDIKREIIFFDFSDDTETSYAKLLFQDVEQSLNTHNFLMHLGESGIAKYKIIDLSKEFIPTEVGWYGITQNRIYELSNNPPIRQTPAYLITILDYQKLQELGKTLGLVDSPAKKQSYAHLNKRTIRVEGNTIKCFDFEMDFNEGDAKFIFLGILQLSIAEKQHVAYNQLAKVIKLNRPMSAQKGIESKIGASVRDTIKKKIGFFVAKEESSIKLELSAKQKPKITYDKTGVSFYNPKRSV